MKYWYVYIAECNDGSYYTGITTDVSRRLEEHNTGRGAKYTRARRPINILECKQFNNRSEASKEESRIKKLSRFEKSSLIGEWTLIRLKNENS